MENDKSYKEYLEHITTFIFDVDGVLTDGTVTIMPNGDMIRKMNVKDGYAMKQALNNGFNLCIISGGTNEGVRNRLNDLGIKNVYLGSHQKINQLNDYTKENKIALKNVLYMGDDIPDVPVLKVVGLPTCPQDAVIEVKGNSKYISHKLGGKGAVRDVIEQVMKVQGKWDPDFDAKAH